MAILPRFADEWLLSRILMRRLGPGSAFGKRRRRCFATGRTPVATMVIQDRSTLAGLLRDPEVSFGDAYMDGRIEVEGDLVRFLEAIYRAMEKSSAIGRWYSRLASKWMDSGRTTRATDRATTSIATTILGNDFYKLWLDDQLLYTCAYFPTPSCNVGARANRQDGSRLPQAAVAARRNGGGSGLRLGGAGAAHGAGVWRVGEGVQRFPRADCVRARQSASRRD